MSSTSSSSSSSASSTLNPNAHYVPADIASARRRYAAANRTQMACTPCRDAKHRCDGDAPESVLMAGNGRRDRVEAISDHPCSRCASQDLQCWWQSKAKLGRPRKGAYTAEKGVVADTPLLGLPGPTYLDTMTAGPSRTRSSSSATEGPSSVRTPSSATPSTSATSSQPLSPPSPPAMGPTPPPSSGNFSLSTIFDEPPTMPALPGSEPPFGWVDVRPGSLIRRGITAYFELGQRFCLAVLPRHRVQIYASLDQWAPTFAMAPPGSPVFTHEVRRLLCFARVLALIGLRLQDDGLTVSGQGSRSQWDDLYEATCRDLDEHQLEPTENSPQDVVYTLQALLLGATLEYGLAHIERAKMLMGKAFTIIEVLQISWLDNGGNGPPGPVPDDMRRIFWELCIMDVLLCVATSGDPSACFLRRDLVYHINSPREDDMPEEQARACHELRLRAATLLLESVQTIGPPHQAKERLYTLFGIGNDLDRLLLHRMTSAWSDRAVEMVHSALYMVNAARIHMIRATLFSTIDYGLRSCCLHATNELAEGEMTPWAQAQALACMVQAADEIVRVANEQRNSALLLPTGSTGVAPMNLCSPLYCSVRVIGAFGLLAFLTIDGGSTAALGLHQQQHGGVAPAGFEGISGLNVMPTPDEARSKLAETPAALSNLSRVWPVAGHLAVESSRLWAMALTTF